MDLDPTASRRSALIWASAKLCRMAAFGYIDISCVTMHPQPFAKVLAFNQGAVVLFRDQGLMSCTDSSTLSPSTIAMVVCNDRHLVSVIEQREITLRASAPASRKTP